MAKYLIIGVLILVLSGLQYRLWVEQSGLRDTLELKKEIAMQQQQNDQMQARNQALIAEVNNLKYGKQAIEDNARSELGMVKRGEQFYQIATPNSDTQEQNS